MKFKEKRKGKTSWDELLQCIFPKELCYILRIPYYFLLYIVHILVEKIWFLAYSLLHVFTYDDSRLLNPRKDSTIWKPSHNHNIYVLLKIIAIYQTSRNVVRLFTIVLYSLYTYLCSSLLFLLYMVFVTRSSLGKPTCSQSQHISAFFCLWNILL